MTCTPASIAFLMAMQSLSDSSSVIIISGRIARTTAETLRKEGIKAGVFRPITLNPFPREQLASAAKGRKIMTIELDAGQFADDVRLNLAKAGLGAEAAGVKMVNRMGGEVVSVDEAVEAAKEMM